MILRRAEEIAFCAISVGELLSGLKGGNREKENRRELEEFLDSQLLLQEALAGQIAPPKKSGHG